MVGTSAVWRWGAFGPWLDMQPFDSASLFGVRSQPGDGPEGEERFRRSLAGRPIALFTLGRDLRYTWAFNRPFGHQDDRLPGRSLGEVHSAGDAERLTRSLQQVLDLGRGLRTEIAVRDAVTGQPRWLDLMIEPERAVDDGPVTALSCAAVDVTEGVQRRAGIEEARRVAEQSDVAKSAFLAAASHDLRQPLQATHLFLDLLLSQLGDTRHQRVAAKALEALEASESLLSSLLDASALTAGTARAAICDFPLRQVVDGLASECLPKAEAKGLRLRVVPGSAVVRSDRVLLARILRNLLVNAIRYTERGSVLLGCRRTGQFLRIEVIDTGPGIPLDQQRDIFQPAFQADRRNRDSADGLGLGLFIVERTSELLGHGVDLRSCPGKGSAFTVTVPLAGA